MTRDKIFALLGLSSDGECDVPSPDYGVDPEELYVNTARYLLTQNRSLLMIASAGVTGAGRMALLPFWVPHWNCHFPGQNFSSYAPQSKYNASGKTDVSTRSSSENALLAQGCLIDHADEFFCRDDHLGGRGPEEYTRLQYEWLEHAREFVSTSHDQYQSAETGFEVLWHTLIANTDEHGPPVPSSYGS
jgi:hypothetical protein